MRRIPCLAFCLLATSAVMHAQTTDARRVARVPSGPVVVRVRHLRFAEARFYLELRAGDTLRVDVVLATVPLRPAIDFLRWGCQ